MPAKRSTVPPDPRVAARLRALLAYHEVSQNELAKRVGVSSGAVSQWVNGQTAISALNASKIAAELGEDVEFVMGRTSKGGKGLGAVLSEIEQALGADRLKALGSLLESNPDALRDAVDSALTSESKIAK